MGTTNWGELFPDGKWSAFIFISYMALFVNQGIIVTWSQSEGEYQYNTITVVLITEVLKLLVSVFLFCRKNKLIVLFKEVEKYKNVLLLYMVPAFLYCLYNNLAFVNLAAFDPTTYYLLLQFRVVVTGIIYQVIFKKQLSTKQWLSLLLLTFGCIMKHVPLDFGTEVFSSPVHLSVNTFFIFVQIICSCLAGVYNEYLLKGHGANINIFTQNVFMYIDSIICNLIVLTAQGNFLEAFDNIGPSILLDPKVVLIITNNAAIGIITSFFLKNLNSILKTFASALELIFTAILCLILFKIPIHMNTVIAIATVCYAVILYSQNPVQNTNVTPHKSQSDKEELQPLSREVLEV